VTWKQVVVEGRKERLFQRKCLRSMLKRKEGVVKRVVEVVAALMMAKGREMVPASAAVVVQTWTEAGTEALGSLTKTKGREMAPALVALQTWTEAAAEVSKSSMELAKYCCWALSSSGSSSP
jgi:hypothetical protein